MRISDWSSDVCSSDLPRSEMSASITFAPSRANTRACAAPRPLAAPVTITTLSFNLSVIFLSYLLISFRRRVGRPCAHTGRSEEHTSELQSLMRISYAVFCLKKKITDIPFKSLIITSYHRKITQQRTNQERT